MRITTTKRLTALLLSAVCFIPVFTGCDNESSENSSATSQVKQSENKEVTLKNDFYTAVNQQWLESTEVPDNTSYVSYLTACQDNITKFYYSYVNNLAYDENLSDEEEKLLILYKQFTEGQAENSERIAEEYAQTISEAETLADIENLYADEKLSLYNGLFNLELTNTKTDYALEFTAMSITGTNLSDSPYILDDSSKAEYVESVKNLLLKCESFDEATAQNTAEKAVDLESKVAQCFAENYSSDEKSAYNPGSDFIFNMDFPNILTSLGYNSDYQYVVCSDSYMNLLNDELLTEENVENLKAYLTATTVCRIMGMSESSSQSDGVQFNTIANYLMEDVMVNAYINENITDEDVDNINKMVDEIVAVYKDKINDISYLSDDAKDKALRKIENLNVVIARPQAVISYKNADVSSENSYVANCENCLLTKRSEQNKILQTEYAKDKPVFDTMEVNAYYNVGSNSIIINAGILQAPVYSRDKSFEENLGGIGTVVAHEVSHSLDITGSEYDENGDYKNWWSTDDRKAYIDRTTSLKDFMTSQGEKDDLILNATETKNEDIADLTAVQCCVEVMKNMDNPDYEKFFTDYAKLWREKYSDGMQEYRIQYDTHSLGKYRVNVPLQQIDEFYTTFDIKEGDGMYVAESDRISVW